ncbi:zinc finger protein 638 isoform X2 [Tachyglossus aculeatus]|uniref:zinc finger protein 638 isoform X2 n=1 Tax=Tachyglossus aculeatus TaxID=9261 RepID=UPI0018F2FFAA|nr:zinc finger protein 638 isoform X2 [Tachyglossus aculeatus]
MSRPMFNPRGPFPGQRPRAPNSSGMKPQGAFMRTGLAGPPRLPPAGRAQGIPPRFGGQDSYQRTGSPRANVQAVQPRMGPRLTKTKADLQATPLKIKTRVSRWDNSPHPPATGPTRPVPPTPEQSSKAQSRYTNESASSILASFGLSHEDLEELSRYPDEQLTPENMPLILREIRIRKMGRRPPPLPSQSRGKEPLGRQAVSSSVIDYGHASKYSYTKDPHGVRVYDPEVPTEDSGPEFPPQADISLSSPPTPACSSMFPVGDVTRPMGFRGEPSSGRLFFPADGVSEMSRPKASPGGQAALEPGKCRSQSLVHPLSHSVGSPASPSVAPSSFPAELISAPSQPDRMPHDPGINPANAQIGSAAGQKGYPAQDEAPIQSPFGVVKASWLPKFSQADAQKMKRLPTPSMMNDYYAASPRIFPHMCSLCNVECSHLKDWIQHQNTPIHIESCRQLRQQYPDWNPEVLLRRNDGERKENQTPKRHCDSTSSSPRHSRGSSSGHKFHRSQSRSPCRYGQNRARSRSPRPSHRFSPRHRSKSPQRSRNPLRCSPRPQRSASTDWSSKRAVRSPDKKAALEAVVQSLGHGFVAEFNKQKNLRAAEKAQSDTQKTPYHAGLTKVPVPARSVQKELNSRIPENPSPPKNHVMSNKGKISLSQVCQDKFMNCGTVIHISDLPDDGYTEQDIKKLVQPFGKVSDLLIIPSRNEAYLEMHFKEAVTAAVKFSETEPVLVKGRRVKMWAAGKKTLLALPAQIRMDADTVTSQIRDFAPILKKDTGILKTVKSMTSLASTGQKKIPEMKKTDLKAKESLKPTTGPENLVPAGLASCDSNKPVGTLVDKAGAETNENVEPATKELDMCVVVVSNLPEKGYSIEEVSNLAKPFGGLKDVLIMSTHKKAYMEISRKSADSMVKFYTCFPMSVDGSQLSVSLAPENTDIRDKEAVFMALIKESDSKANLDTIYKQFVLLGNLPDDGYSELELVCVGLRFGKVDHYVVFSNKNKAIIQLDSPESAKTMCSFLQQYPFNLGEKILTCALSTKKASPKVQVIKEQEQRKESPGLKNYPVGTSEVQTAADKSPVNPNVIKKEVSPPTNIQILPFGLNTESFKGDPERAAWDSGSASRPVGVEQYMREVEVEIADSASILANIGLSSEIWKECGADFHSEDLLTGDYDLVFSPSPNLSLEGKPEESSCEKDFFFTDQPRILPSLSDEGAVEFEVPGVIREEFPLIYSGISLEGISIEDEQAVSNPETPEKSSDPEGKEEDREDLEEARTEAKTSLDTGEEKSEKNEAKAHPDMVKLEKMVLGMRETAPWSPTTKTCQAKGTCQAQPSEVPKTGPQVVAPVPRSKVSSKAVLGSPSPSKARVVIQPNETKPEEPKAFSRPELRSRPIAEKKLSSKEMGPLRAGGGRASLTGSSGKAKLSLSPTAGGGGRKSPIQQDKDSRVECRGSSKQSQERQTRSAIVKMDDFSNKAPAGRNAKNLKTTISRNVQPKEEEELFPFNLDEFVTVDEVIEEVDPPTPAKIPPPRGKRKEPPKNTLSPELGSKRRKEKSLGPRLVESELSFVTLDEIGEEEEAGPLGPGEPPIGAVGDPRALVTVDEVIEEEELVPEAGHPHSLVTLDEIIEPEDGPLRCGAKTGALPSADDDEEREPLVTVDEIGEVEELLLSESSALNLNPFSPRGERDGSGRGPLDFLSAELPEDPTALVTVDELHEDSIFQPLVTLDEVTEEDEEFLEDFNSLKEELNFVTVDEVGEEEECESSIPLVGAQEVNSSAAEPEPWERADAADLKGRRSTASLGTPQEKPEVAHSRDLRSKKALEMAPQAEIAQHPAGPCLRRAGTIQESEPKPESKPQPPAKTPAKRGRPRKRPLPEDASAAEPAKPKEDPRAPVAKMEPAADIPAPRDCRWLPSALPAKGKNTRRSVTVPEASSQSEDGARPAMKTDPGAEVHPPKAQPKGEEKQPLGKPGKVQSKSGNAAPEKKRRKAEDPSLGKSKTSSFPQGLDFLVPKAGFFCQICSLFYSDQMTMANHCRGARHQQNMEKFIAKQKEERERKEAGAEEKSST